MDRKTAERKVGLARLWARAKQIVTTDPSGSDEDDLVVDEEAARVLAVQAGKLKGGLAKVAQLAGYWDHRGTTALATLWDNVPAMPAGDIARVVEQDLGKPPQQLFARWEPTPLAAASLGQVHAARTHDGQDVVVKVQYPGVADALRADLDDDGFVRKLAGSELARTLDDDALAALGRAVRGELDNRAEAAAQARFARAWEGDRALRFPRVIDALSSARVLTMTRAKGRTIVDVAAHGERDTRRAAAQAIFRFAWGSPLVHGLVNADPNPGNFLIDVEDDGHVVAWCLDFGCTVELPPEVRDADREIFFGLLDDDGDAERFRLGIARAGLLARADTLATTAHRDWERALARPLQAHGDFHWDRAYAAELADTTARVLAAGGVAVAREAAPAVAPADRRGERDRPARRRRPVPAHPARPDRDRTPRASLDPAARMCVSIRICGCCCGRVSPRAPAPPPTRRPRSRSRTPRWSHFALEAKSGVKLLTVAAIEGKRDGKWTAMPVDVGDGYKLVAACTPNPDRCNENKGKHEPVPWTGMSCSSQCNGTCDKNAPLPAGEYRLVVRTCDGAQTIAGPSFQFDGKAR